MDETGSEAFQEAPNMFEAFLEEHRPSFIVNVVAKKRARFARLDNFLAKYIFLQEYEKALIVLNHMESILAEDEYADEYANATLIEIYFYFDITHALINFYLRGSLLKQSEFLLKHLPMCGHIYPLIYWLLVACYMKLNRRDEAMVIVYKGLNFIITHYSDIDIITRKDTNPKGFFKVTFLGENTPDFVWVKLFGFSRILGMDVDSCLVEFKKLCVLPFDFDKALSEYDHLMEINCCLGSAATHGLNRFKSFITTNRHTELQACMHYMHTDTSTTQHEDTYCSSMLVFTNHNAEKTCLMWVTNFSEIALSILEDSLLKTTKSKKELKKLSKRVKLKFTFPSLLKNLKRKNFGKIALRIGKPFVGSNSKDATKYERRLRKVFMSILGPFTNEFNKHILIEGEVIGMYLQAMNHPTSQLATTVRNITMDLYELKEKVELFCNILFTWRKFIAQYMSYLEKFIYKIPNCGRKTMPRQEQVDCCGQMIINQMKDPLLQRHNQHFSDSCMSTSTRFGVHYNFRNNRHEMPIEIKYVQSIKVSKDVQTNYSKFSCRAKQTQTDKYSQDDLNLLKQVNDLQSALTAKSAKVAELEGKILEMQEAKKDYSEKQNNIVKGLKKEVAQSKRVIYEKSREITQQKIQIEQLQQNLSNLNKPYSHAVKPPEELVKAIKDNEILKLQNSTLNSENVNLTRQLDEMTEEFDKMKVKRDLIADVKEEVALKFREKSEICDKLCIRMKALDEEHAENIKDVQKKIIDIKSNIINSVQDFIDLLMNKLNQYKTKSERVRQDISCFFYSSTQNLNMKQMCESNQLFLLSISSQIERNIKLLVASKEGFHIIDEKFESYQMKIDALNWKDLIVFTDEFCTSIFNQYVFVLNSLMAVHGTLGNALVENAKLISQNINVNTPNYITDPERYYRSQMDRTERRTVNNSSKTSSSSLGAIGSNRSTVNMGKIARPPTPEIDDPNTKNILSQIGHAVSFPPNMTLTPGVQRYISQCGSAGSSHCNYHGRQISNSSSSCSTPSPTGSTTMPSFRLQSPPVKDYNWNQQKPGMHVTGHSFNAGHVTEIDDNAIFNGIYRDIFYTVKKRFPAALITDLVNALKCMLAMNINLHNMSYDIMFENVGNYIERQMQIRTRTNHEHEATPEVAIATDEFCPICFEKLNIMPIYTLRCLHIFHEKCIGIWLRQNSICPICRKITIKE